VKELRESRLCANRKALARASESLSGAARVWRSGPTGVRIVGAPNLGKWFGRAAEGNKRSQTRSGPQPAERGPLGQQLFVPHKGVTALLAGLTAVLVLEGFQPGFHGIEDRVVLVHRFVATDRILTESEDCPNRSEPPLKPCVPRGRLRDQDSWALNGFHGGRWSSRGNGCHG
jgi:hypothetical protein